MTRSSRIVCALAVLLLPAVAATVARAEHTRFWREADYAEFRRGTASGVALRSDGTFTPAPRLDSFADPGLAYLWALRSDAQGRLYAAGGSDAKVLRFDAAGKSTTVFESSELIAQSIVFDAKGNLFVGTSPDGKVYKVTPDGTKSTFFDPKTKYIWALAIDAQGNLFVGTGDKGQVFVVTPDGNGKQFYGGDQHHARSLAFDARGNLLVGTEPDGLILRLPIARKSASAPPEAGNAFVVYETSRKEVTSLATDASGNIYASSIGEKSRTPSTQPVLPIGPQGGGLTAGGGSGAVVIGGGGQGPLLQQTLSPALLGASVSGTQIVKIAPDDSPEELWASRDDIVLGMAVAGGKVLLGTGNHGSVVRLEGAGIYSDLEQTHATQVTSLVAGADGKIYAATANPGRIFTIGPGMQPDESFVSDTYDTHIFSRWGRLSWFGETGGAQDRVEFYVRSGNTSNPEQNWSAWTGPYKDAKGETITAPAARFIQWKAVFPKPDPNVDPSVSWVNLAFQPKNVAPVVDDIAAQDPGVRVSGFGSGASSSGSSAGPVQMHLPQRPGAAAAASSSDSDSARSARVEITPTGTRDHGYQSVLWSAHDDNDDDLTFTVYYRGESETNWRLLKDKVTDHYYSWDTSTMPDGVYYLKIVASDSPSNPPDQALTAQREGGRFEVGNALPQVVALRTETRAGAATISFSATSSSGAVARASYSLDGGDWLMIFPVGQLTDAPKEDYRWDLSSLTAGEHTIAVQVTDRFGNVTAAKITFSTLAGTVAR
jgi:sugar lactone lactonase YvrE